jgi:predicted metal-dependent hydrolase
MAAKDQASLKPKVRHWAARLNVKPSAIRVRKMKRKWGSCSAGGTVTLAADLSDQSPAFQRFVIVHELLHLKVRNHGRLFNAMMSAHVPHWRQLDLVRRKNGMAAKRRP